MSASHRSKCLGYMYIMLDQHPEYGGGRQFYPKSLPATEIRTYRGNQSYLFTNYNKIGKAKLKLHLTTGPLCHNDPWQCSNMECIIQKFSKLSILPPCLPQDKICSMILVLRIWCDIYGSLISVLICHQTLLCFCNQSRRAVFYFYFFSCMAAYMLWEEL